MDNREMVTAYFWEKETGYLTVLEQDSIYIKQGMSACKLSVTMVCNNINSGFKFSLLNDFYIEHFIESRYCFWDLKKHLEQNWF